MPDTQVVPSNKPTRDNQLREVRVANMPELVEVFRTIPDDHNVSFCFLPDSVFPMTVVVRTDARRTNVTQIS